MTQLATQDDARLAHATETDQFSFVAQSFDDAWAFAECIARSDLAPTDYKGKPANVLVAIQMGGEVGLKPMQALQSIAIIKGRPTLWGDGLLGVVRASPLCEWIKEYTVGTPGSDTFGWVCEAKRVHDPNVIKNTFTVADAKVAQLWGKEGPWKTYGESRMCKMRARSWTCRDGFADILKGLKSAEEVLDIPDETREAIINAPTRREAVKIAIAARNRATASAVTNETPPTDAAGGLSDIDYANVGAQELRDFFDRLAAQNGVTAEELAAIIRGHGGFKRSKMPAIAVAIRGRKPAEVEAAVEVEPVGELVEEEEVIDTDTVPRVEDLKGADLSRFLKAEAKRLGLGDDELEDVVNDHGGWLKASASGRKIVDKLVEIAAKP